MVTISPRGPIQRAMVGSPLDINCTVSMATGVNISSVDIMWMYTAPLDDDSEGVLIMNDSRITVTNPFPSGDNSYTSSLRFAYLMANVDEGMYNCSVMILNVERIESVTLTDLISKSTFCSLC